MDSTLCKSLFMQSYWKKRLLLARKVFFFFLFVFFFFFAPTKKKFLSLYSWSRGVDRRHHYLIYGHPLFPPTCSLLISSLFFFFYSFIYFFLLMTHFSAMSQGVFTCCPQSICDSLKIYRQRGKKQNMVTSNKSAESITLFFLSELLNTCGKRKSKQTWRRMRKRYKKKFQDLDGLN